MTHDTPTPTLFETYNARFLEPSQIAGSFVIPPNAFRLLCKNENSILIGPRGSGKTTLMKMLRPATLNAWKHKEKEDILSRISFIAVYVGSDSSWTNRLSLFSSDSEDYQLFEILQAATAVTYTLDAILETLRDICEIDAQHPASSSFSLGLSEEKQVDLLFNLAKLWKLDIELPSFRGLKFALQNRLQQIDDIYFQCAVLKQKVTLASLSSFAFIGLDIVTTIQSSVARINEITGNRNQAWVVCIDEIEILPVAMQGSLMASLRSVSDQRLRFKVSASPFSKTSLTQAEPTKPMGGHDFTPITLTYARKHEALRFGREMLDFLISEVAPTASALQLLGKSHFEAELPKRGRRSTRYQVGGARQRSLSELERDDPGFAAYLSRRDIDLSKLDTKSEEERAEVRKLIQIAEIRRQFGVANVANLHGVDVSRHRSRKRVGDLYTGAEALLTICEGNPRWLIGILRPLLENIDPKANVSRPKQARSVATAVARYLALLSTIPFNRPHQRTVPVTKMLDQIGDYFFNDITAKQFKTEPALSFIVDDRLGGEEIESIGAALNQGAFVFIPNQDNEHCMGDIKGKRFRVSYLLCPRYKLPLMYGQHVRLSRIIGNGARIDQRQYTLTDIVTDV